MSVTVPPAFHCTRNARCGTALAWSATRVTVVVREFEGARANGLRARGAELIERSMGPRSRSTSTDLLNLQDYSTHRKSSNDQPDEIGAYGDFRLLCCVATHEILATKPWDLRSDHDRKDRRHSLKIREQIITPDRPHSRCLPERRGR